MGHYGFRAPGLGGAGGQVVTRTGTGTGTGTGAGTGAGTGRAIHYIQVGIDRYTCIRLPRYMVCR